MKRHLAGVLAMSALVACATRATPPAAPTPPPAPPAAPAPAAAPAPTAPPVTRIEVADGVTVTIHPGGLAPGVSGWTLVTHGLATTHQRELVLALAARRYDSLGSVPTDAVDLLRDLATASGLRLEPWSVVHWTGGALRRADLVGLVAIPAVTGMPDLELPPDALSLLVLTSAELDVAKTFGAPRVAAMLAHQLGHAFATWVDLERSAMLAPEQVKRSAWWARMPTSLPGVTARLEVDGTPERLPRSGRILGSHSMSLTGMWVVRVTPDAAADFAERLRHVGRTFKAYSIRPDAEAGARFVWRPERDGFELVVGTPSRTQPTVSLLGFGADASARGGQLGEDGLAIYLSYAQRDALIAALVSGADVTIEAPSAGLMPWRVEWVRP
jgi:hypothetical protein